jgi:hypothetical protein
MADRTPVFTVSQPSAEQVDSWTVRTDMAAAEALPSSRHRFGVVVAETSAQPNPPTPTRTTCPLAVVALGIIPAARDEACAGDAISKVPTRALTAVARTHARMDSVLHGTCR